VKAKVSTTEAKLGMVRVVAPTVWEVKAMLTSWPLVKSRGVAAEVARDVADATPKTGVTKVGVLAKTKAPEPVSSVTAEIKLAEEAVAKKVATPVPSPLTPVLMGRPVALVKTPEAGVPKAGATKVLLLKVWASVVKTNVSETEAKFGMVKVVAPTV